MTSCTSASAGVNGPCGLEPAAFESGSGGVRGSLDRRDRDRARSGDPMPNANAQRQKKLNKHSCSALCHCRGLMIQIEI